MYKLRKLPYNYQDLEPFIDTHTVGLHYQKHQRNYLNKLNELLVKANYDFKYKIQELPIHMNEFPENLRDDILYNLGGVLNHNIYFGSMGPVQILPEGKFKEAFERQFGTFEHFKELFLEAALALKGVGYTFLVVDEQENLRIVNMQNQVTPYSYHFIPLLALDLWEHSYYLNYKNEKKTYIENYFDIIDFSIANGLYSKSIIY